MIPGKCQFMLAEAYHPCSRITASPRPCTIYESFTPLALNVLTAGLSAPQTWQGAHSIAQSGISISQARKSGIGTPDEKLSQNRDWGYSPNLTGSTEVSKRLLAEDRDSVQT